MSFLAACIQQNGCADPERCLDRAEGLVRRAAATGASLVATPENTTFLGPQERKVELAEPLDGPTCRRLAALAAELRIHLLVGSVPEAAPGLPGRCFNTSLLYGPGGELLARYRKLHLFDVDVPGGASFRESESVAPGDRCVVASTGLGRIGMSICYDLRFPEQYRALAGAGAEILAVPSAFTLSTGRDHWHPLLRARAIETQCFVLAPAQWGPHDEAGLRRSYGHALIAGPWGTVLAECGDGEGFCVAEVDLERVERAREAIPLAAARRRLAKLRAGGLRGAETADQPASPPESGNEPSASTSSPTEKGLRSTPTTSSRLAGSTSSGE